MTVRHKADGSAQQNIHAFLLFLNLCRGASIFYDLSDVVGTGLVYYKIKAQLGPDISGVSLRPLRASLSLRPLRPSLSLRPLWASLPLRPLRPSLSLRPLWA